VLVVDFCYGFTDPSSPFGVDASEALHHTAALLATARRHSIDVAFTTLAFPPDLAGAALAIQKKPAIAELLSGTRWAEIDERVAPRAGEPVVVKQAPSALFGTDLTATLEEWGTDTVTLCGASTSGCVRATAVDLYSHGIPTLVPRECVTDRWPAQAEASLFDIDAKYGDVVTVADVSAYLAAPRSQTSVVSGGC